MKLKSIELGFSSSLYEVKLNFTNGASGVPIKTDFAGKGSALKKYNID